MTLFIGAQHDARDVASIDGDPRDERFEAAMYTARRRRAPLPAMALTAADATDGAHEVLPGRERADRERPVRPIGPPA